MSLSVRIVLPGRACVRIFHAKFTVSGNAFERSKPILWRILSTEFTETAHDYWLLERLDLSLMAVLLILAGKCSGGRAKSAHVESHLPAVTLVHTLVLLLKDAGQATRSSSHTDTLMTSLEQEGVIEREVESLVETHTSSQSTIVRLTRRFFYDRLRSGIKSLR
jgi:hypothetical protein